MDMINERMDCGYLDDFHFRRLSLLVQSQTQLDILSTWSLPA